MSTALKTNRTTDTTNTASEATAQAALADSETVSATPNGKAKSKSLLETKADPTDVQFYLDNMRVSEVDAIGAEPYTWKDPEKSKFYKVVWFPISRYHSLKDALLSRFVVLVEKSGSIQTIPFSGENGLFTDSSFDVSTGRVHSKFVSKNEQLGIYEPEMVMCLQPIAAHQAMQQRMVERVKEKTERKPEARSAEERAELYKVAQDAGARKGAIQVSNYEGYDNL